jgi:vanillate O-demethylase monooxygenase subunit
MSFVRNAWYVAAWASEIGRKLERRTVIDDPMVLYRTEAGEVVALEDRCPHRFLPLSMGKLRGDEIECGYHGLTFDCSGKCVRIPGQDRIPPTAKVHKYPVVENMGLVWVWPGDPEIAAKTPVYDLPEYHDPDWGVAHGDALPVDANYISLADNLCDPAHVSFVHGSTLGSAAGEDIPIHSERQGDKVLTWRWTLDSDPVPFFQIFGDFEGKVDRWQYYHLYAPSTAIIDFGSADAGTGAPEGNRDNCIQVYSCHFLTPVNERQTIDYWLHVRNFAADDPSVGERISDAFRIAFAEDKEVLQAIQLEEDRLPDRQPVRIAIDAGANRLHKLIREMIEREQVPAAAE